MWNTWNNVWNASIVKNINLKVIYSLAESIRKTTRNNKTALTTYHLSVLEEIFVH